MRILTWNVNVLRTVLDYHPWSSMKNKSVEGLLDELGADIACFQEHKTRRPQVDKAMACPGKYDGFWTWPRSRLGYSGVCTYVNSELCVPLRAEEGITGLLLGERGGAMRPPWTEEERVGWYPDVLNMELMDELDGKPFDPRSLDMEGRAVVCDFGMFVLFNLYCPNETNETRRPYKMNFLHVLQARVDKLMAAGREVIIAGDMNVMRAPIDSGEGGIKSTAEQHYEHPARRWFDAWCAPKGPMIDVVRESFPEREGMFTCWNTKIDARSANYGSRIDYILCTPGLRPWIKGGDIQAQLFGSDHCPVYVDLHDSIETDSGTVHIRDLLNPQNRPPSTAPVYPSDVPRTAPEPPRFATKFLDEFSAKQRTLMSLWAKKPVSGSPSPSPVPENGSQQSTLATASSGNLRASGMSETAASSSTLGIARAAFESLDQRKRSASPALPSAKPSTTATAATDPPAPSAANRAGDTVDPTGDATVDLTGDAPVDLTGDEQRDEEREPPRKKTATGATKPLQRSKSASSATAKGKAKASVPKKGEQPKLAAFWSAPAPKKASLAAPAPKRSAPAGSPKASSPAPTPGCGVPGGKAPPRVSPTAAPHPAGAEEASVPDTAQDEQLAQALASADADRERERQAKNDEAAPVWSNLFAKKLPPLCTVHQKPCKDFIVKIPGPNKGKRFWLCSLPVGPGYDTGRSKRPREEVNRQYKCDFFLWDSANSRKETPTPKSGPPAPEGR